MKAPKAEDLTVELTHLWANVPGRKQGVEEDRGGGMEGVLAQGLLWSRSGQPAPGYWVLGRSREIMVTTAINWSGELRAV